MSSADIGLNHILTALDVIAEMALNPKYAPDVASCQIKLCQVKARAELILRLIEAQRPPPTKVWRQN